MTRLTIHDLDGGVLAFDLRDVIRVLAPRSLAATWTITSPEESSFEATGVGGQRLEELAGAAARIAGDELLVIADDIVQVIWGYFVGALPDDPHQEWLTIRAFDSSFYEVETSDADAVEKVKSRFSDVRIVKDPH